MQSKDVNDVIEFEIKRIENLLTKYNNLLEKVKKEDPNFIELGSLAMLLHSYYNGLENIFSRIAKKIDGHLPKGEFWHKELLDQMASQSDRRKYIVLKPETYEDLKEYLGFRRFSRHAYAFELDWNLMKDIVLRINKVNNKVIADIKEFLNDLIKKDDK
ncbi:MAG: hypothetical protein ACTSRG_09535 [Candidatus Helarchaeota archaeon]